jgi:hypothetical protein
MEFTRCTSGKVFAPQPIWKKRVRNGYRPGPPDVNTDSIRELDGYVFYWFTLSLGRPRC